MIPVDCELHGAIQKLLAEYAGPTEMKFYSSSECRKFCNSDYRSSKESK